MTRQLITNHFGYSMGAGIALAVAIRYPDLVRKLVLAAVTYNSDGFHPGTLAGMETLKPEDLAGTPWQEEYVRTAPNPQDWATLVTKVKQMNRQIPDWTAEVIQSIKAPTLRAPRARRSRRSCANASSSRSA